MSSKVSTYPLRLPASLKRAVETLSARDGTSINQFVVVAVAEKVATMTTAEYFAERRARADLSAFDQILNRADGAPPLPGDEMPAQRRGRSDAPRPARRAPRRRPVR
ncbi:MAG: toxin-antitoxin system HicB family antitoxin [Alphaproteobacteria bacterium]